MNISRSFTCEMAVAAMDQKLSHDDEIAWREHVESCNQCLAIVERAASSTGLDELPGRVAADGFDAALSTADFVVEFLEPATSVEFLGSLANYDIVEIIGRGGMGVVLKAFDRELKRYVAIKTLAPHLASQPLARKRFAREAQAAAAVVDLHVIAIHHVHATGRIPFIVMPLLGGESVADRLNRDGALELSEVLRIGMQVASGLAAAHQQGLVHRDVKPSNILLEKGVERAVLTDFGLARAVDDVSLTRVNAITGTPEYMSPESARGEAVDSRSDLFSLGCVLYTMASGVSPFRADSTMAALHNVTERDPQNLTSICPQLPPWFAAIVEKLLAKDPSQRIQSAREVASLLEQGLGSLQQPAEISPPIIKSLMRSPKSLWSWFKKYGHASKVTTAVAMLTVGLVACFGVTLMQPAPDISGKWRGDGWGVVTLHPQATGKYSGEYTDTFGSGPGTIHLQWSAIKKRFLGTWNQGTKRIGTITIRLDGDELRGAWTVDLERSTNTDEGVKLDDLHWQRLPKDASSVLIGDDSTPANNVSGQPIDLSKHINYPASDFKLATTYPWQGVPIGKQQMAGISMDISGAIFLWGKSNADRGMVYRTSVTGIPTYRTFKTLYICHAALFEGPPGEEVFRVVFHYKHSTMDSRPILCGSDVKDWFANNRESDLAPTGESSVLAWVGYGRVGTNAQKIRFCMTEIENPRPEEEVTRIDLISCKKSAAACIIGLTTGNDIEMKRFDSKDVQSKPSNSEDLLKK